MENLKEKTARGLFWGALNNGSTQVLNLLIGIALARMLSPEEWAPVGVITIFSAIAGNLQSSGFSTAIVNMKQPTANDYNAMFWFNVLCSVAVYCVLFLAAPLIAAFFEMPCLTSLSRLIFLSFFISSFGISTHAFMLKNMMNREIAIVSLTSLVCSGVVAVVLAVLHYSYWALAWQQITGSAVLVIGRFFMVSWRPSLRVDFSPIRRTFRFSMNILVTMIINTVNSHILTFIFGKLFTRTPQVVGNFFQASKWNTMAYQMVGGTIDQVSQPVLVSVRDDEGDREVRVFRKMLRFTALLAFPAMFGLSLVSGEFIQVTIGQKWADCVPMLRTLCIGGAFMPFYSLYKNLVLSQGRSDVNMWLNIGQIAAQMAVILLTFRHGIAAVVWAYTLLNILWLLPWQFYARRLIGVRLWHVASDVLPFVLVAGGVMLLTGWLTQPIGHPLLLLAVRVPVAALLYVVAMKLLRVRMMDECISFLKHRILKTPSNSDQT